MSVHVDSVIPVAPIQVTLDLIDLMNVTFAVRHLVLVVRLMTPVAWKLRQHSEWRVQDKYA